MAFPLPRHRKLDLAKLRTIFLAVGLAALVSFVPGLHAANDSAGLDLLIPRGAVDLLNSVRPQLVAQLASPARTKTGFTPGSTRFKSSGSRLIVTQMVHALTGTPEQEKIYLPAILQAFTAYEQQAAAGGFANDIGGAMALFVAAADLGYRGKEITDAESEVMARQFQAGIDTPQLRATSDKGKQQLYEFLATFGLYLLVTRQVAVELHDDLALARLKPLAGQALTWLFQVSPESIAIGNGGLSLVPGVVSAASALAATSAVAAAAHLVAAPSAAVDGSSALVGIWHGIGNSSTFNSTTNASGTGVSSSGITTRLRGRDIAFLASGWFTSVIPSRGLQGIDPAAESAQGPYYWGRYTFDGRRGTITFVAGSPSTFEFVDGKVLYDHYEFTTRRPVQ